MMFPGQKIHGFVLHSPKKRGSIRESVGGAKGKILTETAPQRGAVGLSNPWPARIQAGMIGGLLGVIFSISHASLITGAAAPYATSTLIGMALVGTAVLSVLIGLFGGMLGTISMSQDVPSAALGAILVAEATARASTPGSGPLTIAEIVILNFTAVLCLGMALLLIGTFRLSAIMRFSPRPVLASFLAGTGFLIIIGAVGICLGTGVSFSTIGGLLETPVREKAVVALAVATLLGLATRILAPSLAIGIVMAGAIILFFSRRNGNDWTTP